MAFGIDRLRATNPTAYKRPPSPFSEVRPQQGDRDAPVVANPLARVAHPVFWGAGLPGASLRRQRSPGNRRPRLDGSGHESNGVAPVFHRSDVAVAVARAAVVIPVVVTAIVLWDAGRRRDLLAGW